MAGSIFDRLLDSLRGATGGMVGGSEMPSRSLPGYFAPLAKEKGGLPGAAVRYIVHGDNGSVIPTLQQASTRIVWRNRRRMWPDTDAEALLAHPEHWHLEQIQRLGEVKAALEPISGDWGHYGTKKSPDWLRHAVSLWLPRERKGQPITLLADLADLTDDTVVVVLDIVFARDPFNYQVGNAAARFGGLDAWLTESRPAIIAAAPALAADVRSELATTLGRFGLQDAYRDMLIDLACGSAKKVRASARQALTACNKPALAEALEARFAKAAPGVRAELVAIAADSLGETAAPLLARWRESETAPKVVAALNQADGTMGLPPVAKAEAAPTGPAALYELPARPDGPDGYTAVDGSWVDAGGPLTLPTPTQVPPEVLAILEPAMGALALEQAIPAQRPGHAQGHRAAGRGYDPADRAVLRPRDRLAAIPPVHAPRGGRFLP